MTTIYLDRGMWGADATLPRRGSVRPRDAFRGIVVHHTVTAAPQDGSVAAVAAHMRMLQTVRPDLGLDVPYSFVVFAGANGGDGIVCEGRGFERTGAHTAGHNHDRYGVALAGNYEVRPPTAGQLDAIRWVGRQIRGGPPAATTGHRDHKQTACPGRHAYGLLWLVQPPFMAVVPDIDDQEDDMVVLKDTSSGEHWVASATKARKLSDPGGWMSTWKGPVRESANMRHVIGDLYQVVG